MRFFRFKDSLEPSTDLGYTDTPREEPVLFHRLLCAVTEPHDAPQY